MSARKDISFFKGSEQDTERRRRLAAALMEQSKQPNQSEIVSGLVVPQSPIAGLAKALGAGLAGYQAGEADRLEQQRKESGRQTLADALGAYQRGSDTTPTDLGGGESIKWNKPNPDNLGNMYANILMGNPETAGMGAQALMGNIQAKQAAAQEMEMFKQKMPLELEKARLIAQAQNSAKSDGLGGDTGILLDRLVKVGQENDPNYNLLSALQDLKGGAGQAGKNAADIATGEDAERARKTGAVIPAAQTDINTDFTENTYRPALDAAETAKATNARIDVVKSLNLTGKTGWGTEAKASAAGVLVGMGIAPDQANAYAADAQIFKSMVSKNVNEELAAQKGPQTEGDSQRAFTIQAQLGSMPEANAFILDMAKAQNNRKIERAAYFTANRDRALKTGNLAALENEWQAQQKSIFDDPIMRKYGINATQGQSLQGQISPQNQIQYADGPNGEVWMNDGSGWRPAQ